MFSIAFVICLAGGECFAQGGRELFLDQQSCINSAEEIMEMNQLRVEEGEFPPHTAIYQCINWGESA